MRIAVIGSGAMGSLFGGLLADAGADVVLIDIWTEHVKTLDKNGLTMETPEGSTRTISVDATTDPGEAGEIDLALLFVKSTHTREAVENAAAILEETRVLTLQNGLGNPEAIAAVVGKSTVVAGVTAHGSTLVGPGHIRHAGRGETAIGNYFIDNDAQVTAIADLFTEAGIETAVTPDIERRIWEKVAVNVGINAATALALVENGALVTTDPGARLLDAAVEECVTVASAEGHDLPADITAHVREIAEQTASNRSSMRQDIENERHTEIERLNAEIVRRGEIHGIKTPVNRTLSDLVRLREAGFD